MTPIERIARDRTVEEIARNYNVPENEVKDLAQHIYLILCQYDQDRIRQMCEQGQIKFFIARLVANQYYSKTSSYFYQYKRYDSLIDRNKTIDSDDDGRDD